MAKYTDQDIKMAFDNAGLADYVQGNPNEIIKNVLYQSQSFDIIRVVEGIKRDEKVLDILPGTTTLAKGSVSEIAVSGDTSLKDVDVHVELIGLREDYSPHKLIGKIPGLLLGDGSAPDDAALTDMVMELKGSEVVKQVEQAIWLGNSALDVTGIVPEASAAGDVKKTGSAPVVLTAANAMTVVNSVKDKYYSEFPNYMHEEAAMFMSPENFATWYEAKFGLAGLVNGDSLNTQELPKKVRIPGTNITIHSILGMAGNNNIVLTRAANFIIGTDLEDDFVEFKYMDANYKYQLAMNFKLGTKIARTNEVVITKA